MGQGQESELDDIPAVTEELDDGDEEVCEHGLLLKC